jgi:hypothetical protein
MRVWVFFGLVACSAPPTPAPATAIAPAPPATPAPGPRTVVEDRAPVDPIAALAPVDDVAYLVPGRVQIELGGPAIEGPGGNKPIEVSLIQFQGNDVRVGVRLEHARFSLWTDRSRLLATILGDVRADQIYRPNDETQVTLHEGAPVRRLRHEKDRTLVRYVGGLEAELWVADGMLADQGPRRDHVMRIPRPTRLRPQHVWSGVVVRREPRWGADQLAVVASAYMLDTIREVDEAWVLAGYDDSDISLTGFISRRDPPGSVHRPRDPDVAPQRITPNAKAPSGSCLYTRVKGEPIGYIVGDPEVTADDLGNGWWSVTVDSPWGPIPFAAQGPTPLDFVACAPKGSVPPSALNPSPPAPAP